MASQSPYRLLRLQEVIELTSLSRATIYRKIADGTFPPQHQASTRRCGWRAGVIDIWLRNPMSFSIGDIPSDLA